MTRRAVLLSMAGSAIAVPTWSEQDVVAEAMRSRTFRMIYSPVQGSSQRTLDSVTLPGRTFWRIPGTDRFYAATSKQMWNGINAETSESRVTYH